MRWGFRTGADARSGDREIGPNQLLVEQRPDLLADPRVLGFRSEVVVAAEEAALTVRARAGRMTLVSDSTAPSEW